MQFWRGIPSEVDFKVERFVDDGYRLISDGYGELNKPDAYGNGAIYVRWRIPSKLRKRFELELTKL